MTIFITLVVLFLAFRKAAPEHVAARPQAVRKVAVKEGAPNTSGLWIELGRKCNGELDLPDGTLTF
jgi:hypothetical protein